MNAQKELRALGFSRTGEIRPVDSGRSCEAHHTVEVPDYAVFAFVVEDEIKRFGYTSAGIKKRINSAVSALKGVMEDPTKPRDDLFKGLGALVIQDKQTIEVWARASTADTYKIEERDLTLKYRPEWAGRPE